MDATFFEQLLYASEGDTLDFKAAQYPFAKAPELEKSELLKDILGFANAWRRADAYILIGVQEVRGGRSLVVGVTEHLEDHSLQQFVHQLTNRPVLFSYEAFAVEGKQVGIIKIDCQQRPFYLKKDFGKLRRGDVYVRRGSSTDPGSPATPDEIASMGQSYESRVQVPQLLVEFADTDRDRIVGSSTNLKVTRWVVPPTSAIPIVAESRNAGPYGLAFSGDLMTRVNARFYQQFAAYLIRDLIRPLRFVVSNVGGVAAHDVQIVLRATAKNGIALIDSPDLPRRPVKATSILAPNIHIPTLRPLSKTPGDIEIVSDDEESRAESDCGTLQPGRKVWSEKFHAMVASDSIADPPVLVGQVFASNLPEPYQFTLSLRAVVTQTQLSVKALVKMADRVAGHDEDDE